MTTDGICPFAVWRPTNNFGYGQGTRGQNRPLFFVDHIMAGWKRTLDDASWREPAGVGVHFGIGKDGSISQYTNILDASWGNGVSGSKVKYDRSNRHLAALEAKGQWVVVPYAGTTAYALIVDGINGPNSHSISTEHEGQPADAWPPQMLAADIRVKRWCIAELARLGRPMTIDTDVLAGHFQIDAVNRASCPGPNWPKTTILQALQSGATAGEEELTMDAEVAARFDKIERLLGVGTDFHGDGKPENDLPSWINRAHDVERGAIRQIVAEELGKQQAAALSLTPADITAIANEVADTIQKRLTS